jgi:hypothetical protein
MYFLVMKDFFVQNDAGTVFAFAKAKSTSLTITEARSIDNETVAHKKA